MIPKAIEFINVYKITAKIHNKNTFVLLVSIIIFIKIKESIINKIDNIKIIIPAITVKIFPNKLNNVKTPIKNKNNHSLEVAVNIPIKLL